MTAPITSFDAPEEPPGGFGPAVRAPDPRRPMAAPGALGARAGERPQRLCILGSTGSIGTSTLDVVALHPEAFEVFALTGQRRLDALFDQIVRWRPRYAAVPDAAAANALGARVRAAGLATEVLAGPRALEEL